ncbi:unnamed protein product [Trifolium pratense]|uniref:Uncharacterized protein n=1 Tax=Trifolium pratense TaxID=57577 RepID=A0ACB0MCY4_TRIPR|nr:unnamed protein product [Trifolium pratense]
MNGANVKQPLLGGLPVTKPHSVLPIVDNVAGLTEPCVKPSASVSQLTIFYAGTVNIFNDIASEKAQTIMLLAGNGISSASNMLQHEFQAPSSKFASGSGSSSSDEFLTAKTFRGPTPTTSASKVETPKVVSYTSGPQSIIDSIFGEAQGKGDEGRPYNLNKKKSEDAPMPNSMVAAKQ